MLRRYFEAEFTRALKHPVAYGIAINAAFAVGVWYAWKLGIEEGRMQADEEKE